MPWLDSRSCLQKTGRKLDARRTKYYPFKLMLDVEGKRILVTGGTGSLGQMLVERLVSGAWGEPEQVIVLSRDEARQQSMRQRFHRRGISTDEIIYHNWHRALTFRIGDIRDPIGVRAVMQDVDIVINAAAMKQVPTCEYFPVEACNTNIQGASNIAAAARDLARPPEVVVGISTDKAVKPVNVMGMTKALQERILIRANLECPGTRFILVRYGNVFASRGSVVPYFLQQIEHGGPISITHPEMTRFLISLDDAVDAVAKALECARPGEILIPRLPSALMTDLARVLAGDREFPLRITGIRPGEKMHEILISGEEAGRTVCRDEYLAVTPMLPELGDGGASGEPALRGEYSSADNIVSIEELEQLTSGFASSSMISGLDVPQ